MTGDPVRCECGALLARRTGDLIELKCRRCRRCIFLRLLPNGQVQIEAESERSPSRL
jgi:phage FluMu protein Com